MSALVDAVAARTREVRLASVIPFGLLLLAIVVNAWMQPGFFSSYAIRSNLASFVPLVAITIGQTIIVLGRGIDLSLGALVTLCSVVTVVLMEGDPANLPLALGAGIGVGILGGLVNGLSVAVLRLQPIVATFATSFVFGGAALQVLPRPGGEVPRAMTRLYRDELFGVPVAGLVIVALLLLWLLIRNLRFGHHLYAVGGDEQAAFASGIAVNRVKVSSYVLGGVFAALASFALLANTGSGDPYVGAVAGAALIGGELTLKSIAALVIGGVALSGGVGGAAGAVAGALILGLITNIVFFAGVPTGYRQLIDGAIVIAALALAGAPWLRRRRRR